MAKISLSDFKRSNMLLLVIVVGSVLLFVFIPEFLGLATKGAMLSKGLSFDLPSAGKKILNRQISEPESSETIIDSGSNERLQEELDSRPPLSQLEYLIDQGYIDYLVETRLQEQQAPVTADGNENTTKENKAESVAKSRGFVPRSELTWDYLQSKDSLKELASASKKSTDLLARIHSSFTQSRVALLSYISAVNQVSTDNKAFSSAKEALELLDRLDRNVTTTMAEEGVPRAIAADWAQISLGSVLGLNRADRLKQSLLPAYNPDPVIVHIVMSRQANGPNYGPARDATVGVKFIVNGDEFKEAQLERSSIVENVFLQKGKIRRFQDREFPELIADYLKPDFYTLVVKNKRGEEFRKVYDFRAPEYNSRSWLHDKRSARYYLKLPYGRPDSPQRFEALFAGAVLTETPTNNLFEPTAGVDEVVISTF